MASRLSQLAQQKTQLQLATMSNDSLRWLGEKVRELKGYSQVAKSISKEDSRYTKQFKIGGLYFFYYNPKMKNELPYYDQFPLVIPLQKTPDGFLGLNIHYLPLRYRLAFMDKLLDLAVLNKDDEIARVRISYDILTASSRYREFKPCVKRYLHGHIQSKILAVQPNEWDIATFLPLQQFKKATSEQVWHDSEEIIRNN